LARLELPAVGRLVAERTAFAPGRELAEALFPTTDLREAERLQDETAAARDLMRRSPSSGLRGARDIRDPLRRAKLGGTLDPVQLIAVADTIRAAEHLFADVRPYPPLAARARFARRPADVAAAIENAIGTTGEVLDRASARLGSLRANLRAAQARLQQRLEAIARWLQARLGGAKVGAKGAEPGAGPVKDLARRPDCVFDGDCDVGRRSREARAGGKRRVRVHIGEQALGR